MSKNTERGIGQHGGPVADGRPDDTRPRLASETSAVGPAPGKLDRDGRANKVEVAQITLLGVQAPDLDRDKVTTPGRDVHLPTEVRRVAAPRAVALDAAASPPSGDRKTPDAPRPRITAASAPSMPLNTQDVISTVSARSSETRGAAKAAFHSAGRRDFGETTVMDAIPETGRGSSIALGIVIALVAAVAVVWTLRFGPHLRALEGTVTERPAAPGDPALAPLPGTRPAREARLPLPRPGTSLPADGAPSGSESATRPMARGWPSPEEGAAAPGTAPDDEASAPRENPGSASREPHFGSPAAAGATDEDGRRKNQRLRTAPSSSGERGGSAAAAPRRAPPPPAFRGGDAPGPLPTSPPPVVGSGRAVSPEPPRFEPPPPPPPAATPVRPAPANEKPLYDPDSPLPPAAGE